MSSEQNLCSMPHDKVIETLNGLIVELNTCLIQYSSKYNKQYIISMLHKIGVSPTTIDTINSIEIKEYRPLFFAQHNDLCKELDNKARSRYTSSIQLIIDMLTREKQRFEKMKEAELQQRAIAEQKKGNEIQKRALYVSIVAIIISLLSLVVAFFK